MTYNHDDLISRIFFIDDWHLNLSNLNRYKRHYKKHDKYQNIIDYIENRYSDAMSFKETVYRIHHHIEKRPVCHACGQPVKFVGKAGRLFGSFCSKKCLNNDKATWLVKHETDKMRHGGILGWNVASEKKVMTRKKTLIDRYGSYDAALQYITKKKEEGMIQKYGVANSMKIPEFYDRWLKSIKKNNPMFGTSKEEQRLFVMLKEKFPDAILHYKKDDRYPFECDFYIPSLDLFVEYQGHQTHGGHPYNKHNINDQQMAKWIKETFGSNLTFTKRDPYKRYLVKKNGLNFKELWTMKEGREFIDSL